MSAAAASTTCGSVTTKGAFTGGLDVRMPDLFGGIAGGVHLGAAEDLAL